VELDFLENTSTPVEMELFSSQALHVSCTQIALLSSPGNAVGRGYVYQNLTPLNYTVDNFSKWLELRAFVYVPGTALLGAFLSYKLQVSPAPASATFADVPTNHPYFRFVEALASAGITGGCGGGNYCVNSPITRGEMAVFLAAALGLHFPN
jgi:hypothetical protein